MPKIFHLRRVSNYVFDSGFEWVEVFGGENAACKKYMNDRRYYDGKPDPQYKMVRHGMEVK